MCFHPNRYGYIFVKAPPSSGKTSLLQLMAQYIRDKGVEAVYLSMARKAPLSDLIFSRTNQTLQDWIKSVCGEWGMTNDGNWEAGCMGFVPSQSCWASKSIDKACYGQTAGALCLPAASFG